MLKFAIALVIIGLLIETIEGLKQHAHPKKSGGRIINGTRADEASFPFLVSIQAHNVTNDKWNHGCGGSIVTDKIVLTACHCVGLIVGDRLIYGNFKRMRIVAGTASLVRLASTAQIRKVKASIAHPKCSNFPENENGWFGSDVSLIVMSKPFQFNERVQPMKLFSYDKRRALQQLKQMVDQGKSCVVPGWGSTVEFKVQHPEFLMASKVKLIPDESCRALYCERTQRHCGTDFNLVGQVCGVSEHSSDCQGDSGGPLVCEGELFGTVSYGERCIPGWPSVFQGIRPILELLKNYGGSPRSGNSRSHPKFLKNYGGSPRSGNSRSHPKFNTGRVSLRSKEKLGRTSKKHKKGRKVSRKRGRRT